jgi:hypothetical protein
MYRSIFIATTTFILSTICNAQLPYSSDLDPRDTFLRTNNDPGSLDSAPIELTALGLLPGDTIRITRFGDFSYSNANTDDAKTLMGVFSGSSILQPSFMQNRIQDAIDVGPDVFTFNTLQGGLPTDIAEDFRISLFVTPDVSTTLSIQIPQGATHLFLGVNDSYFGDNFDPDNDFRLEITGEREVSIDVKPTTSDNAINTRSKSVPVAILGSSQLDVLLLDPATIVFASAPISLKNNGSLHYETLDVNGDGYRDLLAHFDVASLVLGPEATSAELTGQTVGGLQIRGADTIRIVP